jgi:zinc protease
LSAENKKNNGIHNLIGRSLTKGYGKYDQTTLKEDLENKSIQLSGFAGKNAYGLIVHAQSEHQDISFQHALGSLLSPNFKAKVLSHEKKLVLRTLENQVENPTHACFEQASLNHFKGHSYSLPILGTKTSLKELRQKDLLAYHSKNLKNKEILFTYCGDRPFEEIKSLLEKNISSLKTRKKSPVKKKTPKYVLGKDIQIPFDREQVHILVSTQATGFTHKDYLYLKIFTSHLSGQTSELFVEMRDRQGLCYTAQPIHFAALEAGYWGIYMASGNDKVPRALAEIRKLVNKYREKGLEKAQFERIKIMLEGRELLSLQTNDDYANSFSVPTLHGLDLDHYFITNQKIHDLSYEEFQAGIKRILKRKWNTITVGNYS